MLEVGFYPENVFKQYEPGIGGQALAMIDMLDHLDSGGECSITINSVTQMVYHKSQILLQ